MDSMCYIKIIKERKRPLKLEIVINVLMSCFSKFKEGFSPLINICTFEKC